MGIQSRTPSPTTHRNRHDTRKGRCRRQCFLFALFFVLGRLSEFRFGLYMKLDQYINYSIIVSSDAHMAEVAAASSQPKNPTPTPNLSVQLVATGGQSSPPPPKDDPPHHADDSVPAATTARITQKSPTKISHYPVTRGTFATDGKAPGPWNNSSLFLLISTPRSGASWVMTRLDQHESLCASGKLPMDALQASSSANNECTLTWMHERLTELQSPTDDASHQKLSRCEGSYDSTNDPLRKHLPRLCAYAARLDGNYSLDAVSRVYVDEFAQSNVDEGERESCAACFQGEYVRGLRILTADWTPNVLVPLEQTAAAGAKVIRLTRDNLFELYMSNLVPSATNIWWIANAHDKANQLDAFAKLDYAVNVDDMLTQLKKFQAADQINNDWVQTFGGETLWVDFAQVRDEPDAAFAAMTSFLGVAGSNDETVSVQRRLNLHSTGSLAQYNYKMLLKSIVNADIVQEALCANGFGHFIGVHDCEPIRHLVFANVASVRMPTSRRGLEVVILPADGDSHVGTGAKYHAARSTLGALPPESLVFLSEGDYGSLNHHIRTQPDFYKVMADTRRTLTKLEREHPGAVLVSASTECCSRALSNVEPGTFFDSDGQRTLKTCRGKDCNAHGETKVEMWLSFMKDLAQRQRPESDSKSIFLDGSFMAGTATAMIQLIDALNIEPWEDDRAVLADYMYKFPDKVLVDYDSEVFGLRFDGVTSKMNLACPPSSSDSFVHTASPLFLHSSRQQCQSPRDIKTFPAWEESGIAIEPILDHVEQLFVHDKSVEGIDRHFDKEVLYIVDSNEVWGTSAVRDIYRVSPSEDLLSWTHDEMVRLPNNPAGLHRWRSLHKAMQGIGFPYWGWYGDWKNCNYKNQGNVSVPIFTTCAEVACSHGFPTPSYMHVIDSQPETNDWYSMFRQYDKGYPWENKIRKVVWRGALSENTPSKVFDSQRWRLCKLVHELTNSADKDMFDVGLTTIPEFLTYQIDIDESLVGGVVKGLGAMHEFQKYTAILDMDGNSWSSRFRTMLCYNSVAIKVEPAYVDYFFSDLVPWKHYIPVKNDLSDLLEHVAFALDPANDAVMHQIIASANQWCAERSTRQGLVYDMLDTMESYIQRLDRRDPQWQDEWSKKKEELLSPTSKISLVRLK